MFIEHHSPFTCVVIFTISFPLLPVKEEQSKGGAVGTPNLQILPPFNIVAMSIFHSQNIDIHPHIPIADNFYCYF